MSVFDTLKETSKIIDSEMERVLPNPKNGKTVELKEFYELMNDYSKRGGKRLRPFLCIAACEMFGEDPKKAYNSANTLELFQNFVLIHDDIEDGSEERRGKPALHHICGIEKAINVGDALFYKMWESALGNHETLGAEKALKIEKELCNLLNKTLEGQAIELYWNQSKKCESTEEDYYKMVEKKTAWYTIITPCRMGAIIGGADEKYLNALIKFGRPLGMAFQIQDDLLNLIGEADTYGKEIFGDLYEGKHTLMVAHLASKCSKEEKRKVESLFAKARKEKNHAEVKEVFELMKKYGSLEHAKKKALDLANEAKEVFEKEFKNIQENNAKKSIREIIDFVITRKL